MKFYFALLSIACAYIVSCSDHKRVTGKELMPDMLQTDSVQVIYFKSPDEPRYFTYTPVNDMGFINMLINDVTSQTQAENPCVKEGKIYCYKNGEIFNTIFFAYLTDDCNFLRYIKNGNLYYFKMSGELREYLHAYKKTAIEPTAVQPEP